MAKNDSVLVFGAGGHAKVLIDLLQALKVPIAGIVEKAGPMSPSVSVLGIPVIAQGDEWLSLPHKRGIIAIGENALRLKVVQDIQAKAPHFEFITLVHPSACLAETVSLGRGSAVMAGVVVNANTQVGDHCILNTRSSVDHDCLLKDFSSINPGAVLGGNVEVGLGAAVGLGASVIHGIQIGDHTVIGAGAVVVQDIPASVLAYGNPCKVIRERRLYEPYL